MLTISRKTGFAGPGYGCNCPVLCDSSNGMIRQVANEEVAFCIQGERSRTPQLSLVGRPVIAAVAGLSGACERRNLSVCRHFSDSLVACVGDEQIAARI